MRILSGRKGRSLIMQNLAKIEEPIGLVDTVGNIIWMLDSRTELAAVSNAKWELISRLIRSTAEYRHASRNKIYVYTDIPSNDKEFLDKFLALEQELGVSLLVSMQSDTDDIIICKYQE